MNFTDFGGEMQSRAPTMSTVDIAELTGIRHDNLLRDTRAMLDAVGVSALKFEGTYIDTQGKQRPCFRLPRDLTLTLIAGYRADLRLKIVRRWIELEGRAAALAGDRLDRLATAALYAEARRQHTAAFRIYKMAYAIAEREWDGDDDCAKAGERAARLATGVDIRDLLGLPPRPEAVGTATGGDGADGASSTDHGEDGRGVSSLPPGGAISQPLDRLFQQIHDPADDKLASLASIFAAQLAEGDEPPDEETAALLALLADQLDDDEAETDE